MTNDKDSAVLADKSDEYAIGHLSALLEVELHENGHTIGEDLAEKLAEIAVKTVRQPTQSDAMREAWQEYFEAKDELAELERNRDITSRLDRALAKKFYAEDKARRALAALQEQSK